jgi:hypothetical protein
MLIMQQKELGQRVEEAVAWVDDKVSGAVARVDAGKVGEAAFAVNERMLAQLEQRVEGLHHEARARRRTQG